MINVKEITERESRALNIMKAISVLSVIAAHVVSISDMNLFSKVFSSFWVLFGEVGVIVFFVIGGFLYNRKPNDCKVFWKKKFFRIVIPWCFCATVTYMIFAVLSQKISLIGYFKWILGSGTWYYYITIYVCFLFLFKWFYKKDFILYCFICMQIISLTLMTFGITTTIPLSVITDYLNPLHWIGYFSLGILIRKHWSRFMPYKRRGVTAVAYIVAIVSFVFLYVNEIFTYFNVVSSVFCLSGVVIIADIANKIAKIRIAKSVGEIGKCSYCIYLLHMQIVQGVVTRIPEGVFKVMFSPFVGLGVMLVFIFVGMFICNVLPFGNKIKKIVGL